MTNVTISGGLRLFKASENQPLETCIALAGDSTAIFVGDAVQINSEGATNLGTGPLVQAVKQATNSSTIYGVVVGTLPIIEGTGPINLGARYRPASTAQYLLVRPANNTDIYALQDDGSASLSSIDVGSNASLAIGAGNTGTGQSGMQLAATSVSTTATLQLKIAGYVDVASNDPTSAGANFLVTLNNVNRSGGTGTVGVGV
jgi:hypothetical protein